MAARKYAQLLYGKLFLIIRGAPSALLRNADVTLDIHPGPLWPPAEVATVVRTTNAAAALMIQFYRYASQFFGSARGEE
jgi:hypothetical protein